MEDEITIPQGQAIPNEIEFKISSIVNDLDEVLTWMVRQMEKYLLTQVEGGFQPVSGVVKIEEDGEETPVEKANYVVWLSGVPGFVNDAPEG